MEQQRKHVKQTFSPRLVRLLDEYRISSIFGSTAAFIWHAFQCTAYIQSSFFQLLRVGDECCTLIIRKNVDDSLTVELYQTI